jgi:hypothetical protein
MITLSLIPSSSPPAAAPGVSAHSTSLDVQPAAGSSAPTAPSFAFPRTSRPTDDLEAVRAGIRNIVESTVVDLSVAHSLAAGTAVVLPIQGTAFMLDKGADVGNATIHMQDQTLTPVNTINIFPGDAYDMPFTFIVIENAAQAGKVARIHYGTGISFKPSLAGTLTISGNVAILLTAAGAPQGTDKESSDGRVFSMFQSDGAAAGINQAVQLFNPNGSGKRIYIDETFVYTNAASQVQYKPSGATALNGNGINAPQNFIQSGAASIAQVRFGNGVAPPGTTPFDQDATPDNLTNLKYVRRLWPRPFILDPNQGFHIHNTTQNQGMSAGFRWREF